ncbi:MAG: PEP-CTERM sorting domain-containing protein [Microcoleaceae cyanobacterium]
MIDFNQLLPNISLAGVAVRQWVRPTLSGAAAVALAGSFAQPALADPPPEPSIPTVFCFRITDIEHTGDDSFQFEFEVLNWTDQEAFDLAIALTAASDVSFVNGSGDIDSNGRPIGPASIPIPGNQPTNNDWVTSSSSETAIQWDAGTPIPNIDLIGIHNGSPSTTATINAVNTKPGGPGDPFGSGSFPNNDFNPLVDFETIDNGTNVLDGFVFEVDDFDPGEVLSFNWFLTDPNGVPIGTTAGGNNFGFGVMNIARADAQGNFPGPVFPQLGNTGFQQSLVEFAPDGNGLVNTVEDDMGNQKALFGAEFAGGIIAAFSDEQDSRDICPPNGCPLTPVPEPSSLLGLGFAAFGLLASRRKIRKEDK